MQDFLQTGRSNAHRAVLGGASGGESDGAGVVTGATRQPAKVAPEEKKVQLRILLPDKSVTTVTIDEHWRTREVYEVCSI